MKVPPQMTKSRNISKVFAAIAFLSLSCVANSQTVRFNGVPTPEEILEILVPEAADTTPRRRTSEPTPRTIVSPADVDLTRPPPSSAPQGGGVNPPATASARPPRPQGTITQPAEFAIGSAVLPQGIKQMLDSLAGAMSLVPHVTFKISGHTDSLGGPAINDPLSQLRADAAKAYLISRHGIAPIRIVAVGEGDRKPLPGAAPTETRNRRVDYTRVEAGQ